MACHRQMFQNNKFIDPFDERRIMYKQKLNLVFLNGNAKVCQLWNQHYQDFLGLTHPTLVTAPSSLAVNLLVQQTHLSDLQFPLESDTGSEEKPSSYYKSFSRLLADDVMLPDNVTGQAAQDLDSSSGVTCFVSPGNSFGYMNGGYDLHLARCFSSDKNSHFFKDAEIHVKNQILKSHNGYLPANSSVIVDFLPGKDDAHGNLKGNNTKKLQADTDAQRRNLFKNNSIAWNKFKGRYVLVIPTMKSPKKLNFLSSQDSYNFIFDLCWEIFSKVSAHNDRIETDNQLMLSNSTSHSNKLNHIDQNDFLPSAYISNIVMPALGAGYGGIQSEIVTKAMIYATLIFYNNKLSPLVKSFYVLRFLNEEFDGLFNGAEEVPEDYQPKTSEEDTKDCRGEKNKANEFNLYKHEEHEIYKKRLIGMPSFDVKNHGWKEFFNV